MRIEIDAAKDVFNSVLANYIQGVMQRGKLVYNLTSNRLLDVVLGMNWDERIFNVQGDFAGNFEFLAWKETYYY